MKKKKEEDKKKEEASTVVLLLGLMLVVPLIIGFFGLFSKDIFYFIGGFATFILMRHTIDFSTFDKEAAKNAKKS